MFRDLEHHFTCSNAARCLSLRLRTPPASAVYRGGDPSTWRAPVMASLGDNRFNCFGCDYDICRRCHDYLAISRFPGYNNGKF